VGARGFDGASPSADANCPFEFYGVDSCQDLAIDARGHALRIPNLHFQELDVLDALMKLNPAETPDAAARAESKTPLEHFAAFYEAQNGQPLSDEQAAFCQSLIEDIWKEDEA